MKDRKKLSSDFLHQLYTRMQACRSLSEDKKENKNLKLYGPFLYSKEHEKSYRLFAYADTMDELKNSLPQNFKASGVGFEQVKGSYRIAMKNNSASYYSLAATSGSTTEEVEKFQEWLDKMIPKQPMVQSVAVSSPPVKKEKETEIPKLESIPTQPEHPKKTEETPANSMVRILTNFSTSTKDSSLGLKKDAEKIENEQEKKFIVNSKRDTQTGWNCFDAAANFERQKFLDYVLAKHNVEEFRKLVAPDIRNAIYATYAATRTLLYFMSQPSNGSYQKSDRKQVYLYREGDKVFFEIHSTNSRKNKKYYLESALVKDIKFDQKADDPHSYEKDDNLCGSVLSSISQQNDLPVPINRRKRGREDSGSCNGKSMLPAVMHEKSFPLYKSYILAENKLMQAQSSLNTELEKKGCKKINFTQKVVEGDLEKTFNLHPQDLKTYKEAYKEAKRAYDEADQKLQEYCEAAETYKTYINEHYGKQGWFVFNNTAYDSNTTSILDVVARYKNAKIIVYKEQLEQVSKKKKGKKGKEILSSSLTEVACSSSSTFVYTERVIRILLVNDCHFVELKEQESKSSPAVSSLSTNKLTHFATSSAGLSVVASPHPMSSSCPPKLG